MPALNDRFTAVVRDVVSDGSAVLEHPCGQVFFVPGLWFGETAEVRITGFKKRHGYAELLRLVEPSPYRVEPFCPHQGRGSGDCGGCPLQFVDYRAQLDAKQNRVRQVLARTGVGVETIPPIWASPEIQGYRNRAQFKTDGQRLGYMAAGSNRIAAVEDCPILSDVNRSTLKNLLARLPEKSWRPRRKSTWTSIDIDEDVGANAVIVNQRRPFRQANSAQNERMQAWLAAAVADLEKAAPVLELFAGSGNFTGVLATAGFSSIVAVEGVPEAVAAMLERKLPGVRPQTSDLFGERAVARLGAENAGTRLLVLDPPRDGFSQLATLLAACKTLERVAYVSCNLATFARDARFLLDHGFQVQEIQTLDQFPHTPHVELLGLFSRRVSAATA